MVEKLGYFVKFHGILMKTSYFVSISIESPVRHLSTAMINVRFFFNNSPRWVFKIIAIGQKHSRGE